VDVYQEQNSWRHRRACAGDLVRMAQCLIIGMAGHKGFTPVFDGLLPATTKRGCHEFCPCYAVVS